MQTKLPSYLRNDRTPAVDCLSPNHCGEANNCARFNHEIPTYHPLQCDCDALAYGNFSQDHAFELTVFGDRVVASNHCCMC